MTPDDLRAWQAHMGYTYDTASQALGMARSNYANMIGGKSAIDLRTALACGALAAGTPPWSATPGNHHPLEKTQGSCPP